jgi:Flp pilus assembly protein TadG
MSTLPHARAKARALALKLLPARFHRDERGVAAVEFALILPVLVLLYVGVVDITYAVTANRKVTQVTSAVADLTAQAFEVDNQDVQNIFRAANDIMRPYPTAGLQVAITVVDFDGSNPPRPRVGWSEARGRAQRTQPPPIPPGLAAANAGVVFVEVSYNFQTPARFPASARGHHGRAQPELTPRQL